MRRAPDPVRPPPRPGIIQPGRHNREAELTRALVVLVLGLAVWAILVTVALLAWFLWSVLT